MNISDLPQFTPAGAAMIRLHVAQLSGAHYEIETPQRQSWVGVFVAGLVVGAVVTFVGVWL